MAGKRVAVLTPDGAFGTVDESEVDDLPDGARVLTKQQIAEKAVEDRYEALPTGRKVLGALGTAASVVNPLAFGSNPDAPPTAAAYGEGVREGATGGLYQAGMRQLADAVGGKEAGAKYAEQVDQQAEASPIASTLGNVAGFGGASVLGSAAGPVGAIGGLGGLAEAGTERALAGVAAKGAFGRAVSTGAGIGVRGALEGAAYGGLGEVNQGLLHDTPITGEKLYAAMGHGALMGGGLGAALGFGGSLAASGARGILGKLAGGSADAGAALEEGIGGLRKGAQRAAEGVPELAPLSGRVTSAAVDQANQEAWKAAGGGMGLQSTRYAKQAARFGDTKEIGELAHKYDIIDSGPATGTPLQAAWSAFKSGKPEHMLPKAEAARDLVGHELGDIAEKSGARVDVREVSDAFGRVRAEPASIAGQEHVVQAIDDYHVSLLNHLPVAPDGTVAVQDLLKQRKGLDKIVYQETKTLDPKMRVAALREVRGEMEELVAKALDNASGKVPGELRARYDGLKRDFHGLSILRDTLEDSAARMSKHATLGLGEKLALGASLAAGHFASGPALAIGGKLIKERGNAALAAGLKRAADQGTFAKMLQQFDARVSKAAAGALREGPADAGTRRAPKRATGGGGTPDNADAGRKAVQATHAQAADIVKFVGETRANPNQVQQQLDEASAIIGKAAGPTAAQSYTGSALRAINFVASYIPVKERRDPLDPRSVPPLTYDEADRLVRAAKYATKPETVWDDFERGKVTPEGISAAKTFMPESYASFQSDLLDHVQGHMMADRFLSDAQRLRISKLLGYPAGPSFKPAALARLQANLTQGTQAPSAGPQTSPNGPVSMKVQQSGFDSVEARMSS
jgi:hypothetical protein